MSTSKIVALVGTTASGKTKLGVDLAYRFNGEIVSADSRQVYREMDVGTGKDLKDYSVRTWWGRTVNIPYHMIDVAEPGEDFDLARFQQGAYEAIEDILSRGKLPVVVGGTGLYAQATVEGYRLSSASKDESWRREAEQLTAEEVFARIKEQYPDFAARINASDRSNKVRLIRYGEILQQQGEEAFSAEPFYDSLVLGVTLPRQDLKTKIYNRLKERLEQEGMIQEVRDLVNKKGISWQRLDKFGLEYRWVAYYLQDKISYQEMEDNLYRNIVSFAKKQLTWLRRWERQGRQIQWIKDRRQARRLVKNFLKN